MADVDVVEPDRGVAHADFAGTWKADLDVFPAHHLRTTGLVNADRLDCIGHVAGRVPCVGNDFGAGNFRPRQRAVQSGPQRRDRICLFRPS